MRICLLSYLIPSTLHAPMYSGLTRLRMNPQVEQYSSGPGQQGHGSVGPPRMISPASSLVIVEHPIDRVWIFHAEDDGCLFVLWMPDGPYSTAGATEVCRAEHAVPTFMLYPSLAMTR